MYIGRGIANHGNGLTSEREFSSVKRRWSQNSDYEDEDIYSGTHITEERYRTMLGEHILKYKRRLKDSSASPAPSRMGIPVPKSNLGLKARKLGNEHRGGFHELETASDWLSDVNPQRPANNRVADFAAQNGIDRFAFPYRCFMNVGNFLYMYNHLGKKKQKEKRQSNYNYNNHTKKN